MECSRCGAEIHRGLAVCPVCGANLRARPRQVRCRYCGHRFSAELTLCPNCGRERRPEGLSRIVWGGALAIILLVVVGLIALPSVRTTLLAWVPEEGLTAWMATALPTLESAIALETPATEVATRTPLATTPPSEEQVAYQGRTPTPRPTDTPTPEPPTPTFTVTATETPTLTPTAALTVTAVSTSTVEAENLYVVAPGDSLSTIARRFGVSAQALARANHIEEDAQLRVGQQLIIPQGEEEPTPTPQPEELVYVVVPGDTLSAIARRFGVTVEALAQLNGIEDTSRLRVNQQLLIPTSGMPLPTRTPTPTPVPTPTPTPTVALVYPAPQPLSPADGTPFSGGEKAFIELRWEDVGPLQPGEVYVVHLGFLVAPEQITWFYEDTVQGTGWRVPGAFQALAPQEMGRSFRWYVQVEQIRRDADGRIIERVPRSPRSAIWGFTWS